MWHSKWSQLLPLLGCPFFFFGLFNPLLIWIVSYCSGMWDYHKWLCMCFTPGEDFAVVQQEIIMMKDCKHSNIVAYFGSYLRWVCDCCEMHDLLECCACAGQREGVTGRWRCVRGRLCPLWLKSWSVCRRDKLWISMEYCGGGSLQDIYHGNGRKTYCFHFWSQLPVLLSFYVNHCYSFMHPVTGPLSESQIAYMSRETMQVRCGTHFLTFGYLCQCVWLLGKHCYRVIRSLLKVHSEHDSVVLFLGIILPAQ